MHILEACIKAGRFGVLARKCWGDERAVVVLRFNQYSNDQVGVELIELDTVHGFGNYTFGPGEEEATDWEVVAPSRLAISNILKQQKGRHG